MLAERVYNSSWGTEERKRKKKRQERSLAKILEAQQVRHQQQLIDILTS